MQHLKHCKIAARRKGLVTCKQTLHVLSLCAALVKAMGSASLAVEARSACADCAQNIVRSLSMQGHADAAPSVQSAKVDCPRCA